MTSPLPWHFRGNQSQPAATLLAYFHESPLWASLAITAAVAVGAFLLAAALLARGWRLKP